MGNLVLGLLKAGPVPLLQLVLGPRVIVAVAAAGLAGSSPKVLGRCRRLGAAGALARAGAAAVVLEAELPDAGGTDPDFTGGIDQQAMDGGGETGRIRRGQGCSKMGSLREQRAAVPGGEFVWIQGLQQGIRIG